MEDGVLSLEAFPHGFSVEEDNLTEGRRKGEDGESMQGFIRVRKLPVLTERGMGIGSGDEMVFAMSRRHFTIKPFNLPPLDSGEGLQAGAGAKEKEKEKEKTLEF
jgi:elongator complex protein 4